MKWDHIPKDPEMNGKTIFEVNRYDREDIIKTLKAEAMQKIEAGGEE